MSSPESPTLSDDDVEIECPECGTSGLVPSWWLGFRAECKDCENEFTASPNSGDAE